MIVMYETETSGINMRQSSTRMLKMLLLLQSIPENKEEGDEDETIFGIDFSQIANVDIYAQNERSL